MAEAEQERPPCSQCGNYFRQIEKLTAGPKVVRIFECDGCGKLEWDDER